MGINVFIVKSVAAAVPLVRIFRGVLPFWLAMILALAALIGFPQIPQYLPSTMFD